MAGSVPEQAAGRKERRARAGGPACIGASWPGTAHCSALALLLSHRVCHRGCALGIQLVSPSVLPAQGYKTLLVITGSYLFPKSLGARGEISFT